ncbi:glycosyltransferase family 2 protein [Bacillus wiedmannii]|uniref:glycosyltransferase family 2 protein n=1 Tax=Bacillus wiedmannii TaxID=1890302 RepID=UPI000BF137FF|nr:glycosyltransferase [Bacillus wiedmannii]PEL82492.1 glycosyl transferase family A [Bacillus wiedmannii]
MAKVTVLMPVYNGEEYLQDAIDSILNQTFNDFELLIINDGSIDGSLDIVNSYQDPRIKLVNNESNLKLIKTLNKGLRLASGKYIARMDSDDTCHPRRLEIQVGMLDRNPEIAVCGTGMKVIGKKYARPFLVKGEKTIKNYLAVKNCMAHPSIMMRKDIIEKYNYFYDEQFIHAEDYELFQRISENHKVININKPLLNYRLSASGISRVYEKEQEEMVGKIANLAFEKLGIPFDRIKYSKLFLDKNEILAAKQELETAYESGSNKEDIHEIIQIMWLDICEKGLNHGFWIIKVLRSFKYLNKSNRLIRELSIRLLAKCFIKGLKK